MKKPHLWNILTIVLFALVCVELFFLSSEVIYRLGATSDEYNATAEIDVCYKHYIEQDYCHNLKDPHERTPKEPFTCDLQDRVGCYTKGFRESGVSEILSLFQNCNISDWVEVRNKTSGASLVQRDLLLFNGFVCVRHRFDVYQKKDVSLFSISSERTQSFDVYITYTRDYKYDGRYKTKATHLFERICWASEDQEENRKKVSYECTETGKRIVFVIEYFSAKHLEGPFVTDCVYRTDSNHQAILQNDCYESCVKSERKDYLLTYDASEKGRLDYNKTEESQKLLDRCADFCHQEDCQATVIYLEDVYEEENEDENSRVILSLDDEDFRTEAIPLFSIAKMVWVVVAFVSIFFGANFYKLITKSANLYTIYKFSAFTNKRKKQNKKLLKVTGTVTLASLALGLALESIFFDFGKDQNTTFLRKESIKERSVSISVCFELCKIIKDEFKANCSETKLMLWAIGELDESTWNSSEFKARTSVRNNVRYYPIRQDDFRIPYFFRDFKKCFLLFYESKNYWPHLPLQRYMRIYINITGGVPFAHFYLEDGLSYPTGDAKPTRVSVLHWVVLTTRRPRDGCVDYQSLFDKPKDELIQRCIINKSMEVERMDNIPIEGTLVIEDRNVAKYSSRKFTNRPEFFKDLLKFCEKKYEKPACNQSETHLTQQDLFKGLGNITVNLTPFLYESKPFDDENGFIVANRILSFLIIFAGFSIKEFSSALIFGYLYDLFSLYNSQLSRLFYMALSSCFVLHLCLLFHSIIYQPPLKFSYNQHASEIDPSTRLRFCFPFNIELNFNNYTLKDLNEKTLDFSEIFDSLLIFDDDNKAAGLTMQNFLLNFDDHQRYSPFWVAPLNGRRLVVPALYMDDLKCYTYSIVGNKTDRNLNVHYHRLQKLYTFTYSFENLNETRGNYNYFFIYFSRPFSCDLDWDKSFSFGDYVFEFNIFQKRYQDDYFWCKNPSFYLRSLVGLAESIDNPIDYLEDLRNSFISEQFATTTQMPLYPNDAKDLPIKNRYVMLFAFD